MLFFVLQHFSKLYDNKVLYIDKSKLRIKVINGTKKPGLASDFSTYLKSKGYNDVKTENGERRLSPAISFLLP